MTDKEIIEAFIGCCVSHRLECEDCVYGNHLDCITDLYADINALIDRQQAEIEKARAEAIKEFADSFDDELAKLRDTYFERGLKDYSLVCEVIHDYLYRTLREMVGDEE